MQTKATTFAECYPKITRGQVWCKSCGSTRRIDGSQAMQWGWPKCCGYTMTIDSPDEQAALDGVHR
jgi:hypothetical protein